VLLVDDDDVEISVIDLHEIQWPLRFVEDAGAAARSDRAPPGAATEASAANGDKCFLFGAGGSAAAAAMRSYISVVTIDSPACNLTVCCICCFLHSVWRLQRRRPRPFTKGSAPDRAHGCPPTGNLGC
jgi:hypothetical protein